MPLLCGIGEEMHRKYGSSQIVQQLARCGFSVSLDEVTRYLQSVMTSSERWHRKDVASACFTQFVADNVDRNVRTVDGHATFHGMGIISASCFGPGIQAMQQTRIPRLRARLMTREACIGKRVSAVQFCRQSGAGLEKYIIKPLSNLHTLLTAPIIRSLNTLWHAAGVLLIGGGQRPLWTGYMHSVCKGSHPLKSEVRMLPILDLNPSDMT